MANRHTRPLAAKRSTLHARVPRYGYYVILIFAGPKCIPGRVPYTKRVLHNAYNEIGEGRQNVCVVGEPSLCSVGIRDVY